MSIKKVNQLFGYGLYCIMTLRALFMFLMLIESLSTLAFNGKGSANYNYYLIISNILAYIQLFLGFGSIIMIFINKKRYPELVKGYLLGLLGFVIAALESGILQFFLIYPECLIYIKAGRIILKANEKYNTSSTTKNVAKNSEWFYSDTYKQQNSKSEKDRIKQENKKIKIENEIYEWKKLLDSGEIDEETYKEETRKLIEKKQKIINAMDNK